MKKSTGFADRPEGLAGIAHMTRRGLVVTILALTAALPSLAAESGSETLFDAIEQSKELFAEGLVIQRRADPNSRNAQLETPLHRAVEKGMRGLMDALLANGASVLARAANGETALHLAALHADPWFVDRLLRAGADPRARNDDGESVLQWAVLTGNLETTRRLLLAGADPNVRDLKANSLLHAAAHGGFSALVDLLLPVVRDPRAPNRVGLTPSGQAEESGFPELARRLGGATPPTSQGFRTLDIDDPDHPYNPNRRQFIP